jgi:hypothetical protein
MQGTFRIKEDSPLPHRKRCDPLDWDTHERECLNEESSHFTWKELSSRQTLNHGVAAIDYQAVSRSSPIQKAPHD